MLITEHPPNCVDSSRPLQVAEFNTLNQLYDVSFVRKWRDGNIERKENFYRYSIVRREHGKHILIVEYDNGERWWVVGYIQGEDPLNPLDLSTPSYVKANNV